MTIVLLFHQSPCRNFKSYYQLYLPFYISEFPRLPCYERFVALMPRTLQPMTLLLSAILGKPMGIPYIDSSALKVCHIKRSHRATMFTGLDHHGRTLIGSIYGLKLHLVISHQGGLLCVKLTPANTHDKTVVATMTHQLTGLLFGDKAYISRDLFHELYDRGLKLITGIRKNMHNQLLSLQEKLLLRKRVLIETVFDYLKNKFQIEHTRHRSLLNAFVHIISILVAYQYKPTKPAISMPA